MRKIHALVLGLSLASALLPVAHAGEVQLAIEPSSAVMTPDGTLMLDVVATYDGSDKLLGGAFSLSFDAALLDLVSVVLKAPSDIASTLGTVHTVGSVSTLTGVGFASFSGIGGTFGFATLKFAAIGPLGTSPLSVFDAQDLIYSWASESLQPVSVHGGIGSVAVVPEPASLALLLGGLGVVGGAARRRHTHRVAAAAV